ncbi:unnamed protein product [Hydatigera taeniaeformis]|uniref:Guanylate cyclase n=1 Tax=Hydatigena taeniaeformis TaxID=6205 RepID=A0A0R3WJV8_HYDTA|nr:unnamed protein product [Hydatigera taeniaeformis]
MLVVAIWLLFTAPEIYNEEVTEYSHRHFHLAIYALTPDPLFSPEMTLFNFTHSVAAAVSYANSLMPIKNKIVFLDVSKHRRIPGSSVSVSSRACRIYKILQHLQKTAFHSTGFNVLLGPPLDSDCNLVREWIRLGDPEGTQRVQLYQISYFCQMFGFFAYFVNHLADSSRGSLTTPIAAVSVVVQRKVILQGIVIYLLNRGWKRAALFYDVSTTNLDIPETWGSVPLNVRLSRKRQNVPELLTSVCIESVTNFSSFFRPFEDHIDVALILAKPSVAIEFVASIQNLTRIREGRIALIQVDPKDMLAYDALDKWRWHLSKIGPTFAAGRSLIILTALPKGTVYEEKSIAHNEQINLQIASGAALAMRLVQIHLQEGGGNLSSSTDFFGPMRTKAPVLVPTLPNITFRYQFHDDNVIQGSFDLLIFALRPNVTGVVDSELHQANFNDVFNLIDIIHYPPILPQRKSEMVWPGDGQGPKRTYCLIAPCDFVSEEIFSRSINSAFGFSAFPKDVISNKSITLDWDFKLSLMTDMVRGMDYLHGTSLKAHGRLKSTNCVVSSRWTLKITDFGIPKIYDLTGSCSLMKLEEKLWTSPELLRDEEAALLGTKPADVYAFAIIMHEVFCQTKPYGPRDIPVEEILKRVVEEGSHPFRPQLPTTGIPPAYKDILERAWSENPSLRPTFKELNREIEQITKGKKMNIVEHMFKMMENYSSWLEQQVKTRMEELSAEKKRKDLLVRRMLPPVVAEALKAGIAVAPETYDEVSIYISDIVGFTTISAMSTPLQVVNLLNDLYTLFDKTIANYDVYKVETIGDAYMVASGLPIRNGRRHAGEVATMALDLLSGCGTFTIKHLPEVPLRIRIGLHSGPCVAGVVGLTMPRYCLFGDTVNRALKMESSGAAFRIHISEKTKEILDEVGGYHVEYRGSAEFEGGAKTKTYWLSSSDNFHKPLPSPPPLPT